MRILVINLMRLGDFLQGVPVLHGLKAEFPIRHGQLDVLSFGAAKQLQPMLPHVHNWFTLDRDLLQTGLGESEIPLLTSFSLLKEQLDQINGQNYDCVINLSQTRFAGWIAGYIGAQSRHGLVLNANDEAHIHSAWFQYLNEYTPKVEDTFHASDIFFYGSGLKSPSKNWSLKQTDAGREEAASRLAPETIVVQALTSDPKKNWAFKKWVTALAELQVLRPQAQFRLLGSPDEEVQIRQLESSLLKAGVQAAAAIVSLEGALSLIAGSKLLITGDTSIKHLANATETPVLELSLGSSDPRFTGTAKSGNLILQPQIPCGPCAHSAPCREVKHECGERLAPEVVALAAHHLMLANWTALRVLAEEYPDLKIFKTNNLPIGIWLAEDMSEREGEQTLATILERSTLKLLLNREHTHPLAAFGTEGLRIHRVFRDSFPNMKSENIQRHLSFLETEAERLAQASDHLLTGVQRRAPAVDEIAQFIFKQSGESPAWLAELQKIKAGSLRIGELRRAQIQLKKYFDHAQIQLRLIRSIKYQMTEGM